MKKLAAITSSIGYFLSSAVAFAQANRIQISNPDVGYDTLSKFINAALRLAFIVALIAVLVMLVWGALQWILSGGEKEAVGEARGRIINALIGLAILAVAFALVQFAGAFVGINILKDFEIPSPTNPTPSLR